MWEVDWYARHDWSYRRRDAGSARSGRRREGLRLAACILDDVIDSWEGDSRLPVYFYHDQSALNCSQ